MKIKIIFLDKPDEPPLDISKNLYWFKENGFREMDEHGEGTGQHGARYKIDIEEEADGL